MRIAIIDESAGRAAVIHEGLAALDDCEIFVVTEQRGLVARIGEIAPDIELMDLGNPSRGMLEEYFAMEGHAVSIRTGIQNGAGVPSRHLSQCTIGQCRTAARGQFEG